MPSISLTVTCSPEEMGPVLQKLSRQFRTMEPEEDPAPIGKRQWSYDDFVEVWSMLSEGARKALSQIAARPEGYAADELEAAMGMDLVTLGGYLSSIGHRLRGYEDRPPLYERNASTGWKFAMAADVAGFIRDMEAGRPTSRMAAGRDLAAPAGEPTETYENARLSFRADRIEKLEPGQSFRVITREGVFQMTKEQFYRDFGNVAASSSYRDQGIYNYPTLPKKALRYRLDTRN